MLRVLTLVSLCGCSSLLGIEDLTLGGDGGPPPSACAGTFARVCLDASPTGTFSSPDGTTLLNTDTSTSCVDPVSGPQACVIAAETIQIASELRITGERPLILFAATSITIEVSGVLDVSSSAAKDGPGGLTCAALFLPSGFGGGAGGTRGTAGGAGGGSTLGGQGGQPNPVVARTELVGGCSGQTGAGPMGGGGGSGGGAVLVIAPRISIRGRIDASGAGGLGGGKDNSGGGGGGAGGLIVLDGDSVEIVNSGRLIAQGAGGGGGGAMDVGGFAGAEPTTPGVTALGGGVNDPSAGIGGNGGVNAQGGAAGTGSTGGGGGGGGTGVIQIFAATKDLSGSIAPLPATD